MTTARVLNKGRITIPLSVRQALQVSTGDRVEFVEVEGGRIEFFVSAHSVKELKGMFGKAGVKVTIEQMNAAIAAHRL